MPLDQKSSKPCQKTRGQVKGTITISFSENAGRSKKKKRMRQSITLDTTGNISKGALYISKMMEYKGWSTSVLKREKVQQPAG